MVMQWVRTKHSTTLTQAVAMNQSNKKPLPFSSPPSRKIHADFSGGELTTDAGALLLREADQNLGLIDAFDQAIPDPRLPHLITHPQRVLLAQRIFGIAAGYEDLNDHQHLRNDPLWHTLTDHPGAPTEDPMASPPTLCRLENRVTQSALWKMAAVLVDTFIASFDAAPERLTLDLDATDLEIHGHQERRFFHGYYDCFCFLPLYIFCGKRLLVAYLRPSNCDASLHVLPILKLLITRLRSAWPDVRITCGATAASVDGGRCGGAITTISAIFWD
jgi:hypothetical protein